MPGDVRALVWILEGTWEALVDEAARHLRPDDRVTLLYVVPADVVAAGSGIITHRLGRRPGEGVAALAEREARALLAAAQARLGREAAALVRQGRLEREVVQAARDADLLLVARDGDRSRLGPRSLAPATRFVVDHAPCTVLLAWPGAPPPGGPRP
jgi:nucleotide-binding universal stress UspA family protein